MLLPLTKKRRTKSLSTAFFRIVLALPCIDNSVLVSAPNLVYLPAFSNFSLPCQFRVQLSFAHIDGSTLNNLLRSYHIRG